MDAIIETILRIYERAGTSAIMIFLFAYCVLRWAPKAGDYFVVGCAWVAKEFMLPIRDAIIGNVLNLNSLISELRASFPVIMQGQKHAEETAVRAEQAAVEASKNTRRGGEQVRAIASAISGGCTRMGIVNCPLDKVSQNTNDSDVPPNPEDKK